MRGRLDDPARGGQRELRLATDQPGNGPEHLRERAGSANSFVLDTAFFNANCAGVQPGEECGWFVWALGGADLNAAKGFGDSYYLGVLRFDTSGVRIYLPVVRR